MPLQTFSTQDVDVGAIRRTDLPPEIGVVLDLEPGAKSPRHVELAVLQMHQFESDAVGADAILSAEDLAFRDRPAPWPFKPIALLLHRARRDIYSGLHGQAAISLGTAAQLMIELFIREDLTQSGAYATRVEGVLGTAFRNLVADHLKPLLSRLAGDPQVVDRWLRDAYALRNQVAHEGHEPDVDEIKAALRATIALAGEIGEALRADERLAGLGALFPIRRADAA